MYVGPPAGEEEVLHIERDLGMSLPADFRRVLQEFSAEVEVAWFLPEDASPPPPFQDIFCGDCHWNLKQLVEMGLPAREYALSFPLENEYHAVWRDKLPFLEIGNGDYLALDVGKRSAHRWSF